MKISKTLLIVLFLSNVCFSQGKNFKLTYEKEEAEHFYKETKIPSKKLDIVVIGNNKYSVSLTPQIINLRKKLKHDAGIEEKGIIVGQSKRTIFKDAVNNFYLAQREMLSFNYQIKGDLHFFEWELKKDTKKINGYTCKKAVAKKKYNQSVVCWYTDELGISAAPDNLDGVPGTIVYAEKTHGNRKLIYTLKNISYPEKLELPKPNTKFRVYLEKEYYSKGFTMQMTEEVKLGH